MNDTAVVAVFGYRYEAEFARETLKAAGIESIVASDDAGGAYAGMSFTRPIKLLVRASQLDRARTILAEHSGASEPGGAGADADGSDADGFDAEGSDDDGDDDGDDDHPFPAA